MDAAQLSDCAKRARQAWTRVEDAVGLSIEEPSATRIDPSEGQGLLASAMRIVRATHALRIGAERRATVAPFDELEALGVGLVQAFETLAHFISGASPDPMPNLRGLYRAAERPLAQTDALPPVALHFDELVNAIDTAAHVAGLTTPIPA